MGQKKIASVIINALIVILEAVAICLAFKEMAFGMFVYYTVLSNVFLLVSSLLLVIFSFSSKEPSFVSRMKYMSTCVVAVTFLVVVFILAPTTNVTPYENTSILTNLKYLLFKGSMLYMHFICPVLAIFSYTVLEKPEVYRKDLPLFGMIFTLVYAAVLIPLNALGIVRGPYPFLMVRDQSILASLIWFVVILGFAYLIAWTINRLARSQNSYS